MDLNLAGKKVLITGSSKGIGRACAYSMAAEGCNLRLAARSEDELKEIQSDIQSKHGVTVDIFPMDLSKSENIQQLGNANLDAEILINSAGAIPGGPIEEVDEARWRAAWDLKIFGYINLTRIIYGAMRERRDGVIVNVIGMAGERPDFDYIAGCTANSALIMFTKALGGDSPLHGVRVVACNPGPVATDRLLYLLGRRRDKAPDPEAFMEAYMKKMAFGRICTPEECGDIVAFLASDRAAYISGTGIIVDGGLMNRGGAL